jgi:SAM-dependent methyltransferase
MAGKKIEPSLTGSHPACSEAEWWDRFGEITEKVWGLNDELNAVIRSEYLADMQRFLFKPGGRLLDYGCGTGRFSRVFAEMGMQVDGVDISAEQIRQAQREADRLSLQHARYWQSAAFPLKNLSWYDSILLHSVIHHLPFEERDSLLRNVHATLAPGGRLYVYEPLQASPNPPWQAAAGDLFFQLFFRSLSFVCNVFKGFSAEFAAAIQTGWTLGSPGEKPDRLSGLHDLISKDFAVEETKVWHIYSMAYAVQCMQIKPTWQKYFNKLLPSFYSLDRALAEKPWVQHFHCWPLIGIKASRRSS